LRVAAAGQRKVETWDHVGPDTARRNPVQNIFTGGLLEKKTASADIVTRVALSPFFMESFYIMANWSDPRSTAAPRATRVGVADAAYDAGLRSYMLSIYNYMASAVLLTGIVAMLFANSGLAEPILRGPGLLKYVIMLAPLGFIMVLSFGINRLSTASAQMLFWAFAAVMGLSMSSIFLVYTGASVAQTFFATAAAFAGLSLFGYTTKKDLSAFGTFLIMGVVGLLVAMVINMFLRSPVMNLVISFIGVLLFAGLTAYDTQKIKSLYFHVADSDMVGKTVIMGALTLYLDFVNMFTFLLQFMGDRR
jgi:FtsH-binding integral membrane protein